MKRIVITFLFLLTACLVVFSYTIWQNNRPVQNIPQNEIKSSLHKSIEWLVKNKTNILQSTNSILWWMINESALLTKDERLLDLSDEYQLIMKTQYVNSVWNHLFDNNCNVSVDPLRIAALPDYNKLFLFGLTCDEELSNLETIETQKHPNFCWKSHPISPACVTHQLMGFRFMQRRNCQNDQGLNYKIEILQKYILWQLFFDFRVVDVYLQRVLMLADSGLKNKIKPIWLRKIIDAQLSDGGWGNFHGLIPVGKSKFFGFTANGVSVKQPKSNFHTTAQGVFLMSLMQNRP